MPTLTDLVIVLIFLIISLTSRIPLLIFCPMLLVVCIPGFLAFWLSGFLASWLRLKWHLNLKTAFRRTADLMFCGKGDVPSASFAV